MSTSATRDNTLWFVDDSISIARKISNNCTSISHMCYKKRSLQEKKIRNRDEVIRFPMNKSINSLKESIGFLANVIRFFIRVFSIMKWKNENDYSPHPTLCVSLLFKYLNLF